MKPLHTASLLVLQMAMIAIGLPVWATDAQQPETPKSDCFLSGQVHKKEQAQKQGFESLGSMIRLHLDADTLSECKTQMTLFCYSEVKKKGYEMGKLGGHFLISEKRTELQILPDCSVKEILPPESEKP